MSDEEVPRITESELGALIARHKRMNRVSLLLGGSGIVLQIALGVLGDPWGGALILLALTLLIYGFTIYARMRGLSSWFGVLGVLGLVGLIVLMMITPRCLACGGRVHKKSCTRCSAPAPP